MSETTATVLIALIGMIGSILTVLLTKLTRKGLNYLDAKTTWFDTGTGQAKKDAVKERIVEVVTTAAQATKQTFTDDLKAKAADGKLTKEEAAEAFQRTQRETLKVLEKEGIEVTTELLELITEAVVGKLGSESAKNSSGDAAK